MSPSDREIKQHVLQQLTETHERFAELMEKKLGASSVDDVERYFGLLSRLIEKLEDDSKSLRDILREMVADYAAVIIAEMGVGS